jgi:hypothetical protein
MGYRGCSIPGAAIFCYPTGMMCLIAECVISCQVCIHVGPMGPGLERAVEAMTPPNTGMRLTKPGERSTPVHVPSTTV